MIFAPVEMLSAEIRAPSTHLSEGAPAFGTVLGRAAEGHQELGFHWHAFTMKVRSNDTLALKVGRAECPGATTAETE